MNARFRIGNTYTFTPKNENTIGISQRPLVYKGYDNTKTFGGNFKFTFADMQGEQVMPKDFLKDYEVETEWVKEARKYESNKSL